MKGGWGYDVEEGWSGRGLGRVLGRMGWGSLVGWWIMGQDRLRRVNFR